MLSYEVFTVGETGKEVVGQAEVGQAETDLVSHAPSSTGIHPALLVG